jgi:hypothetical protein
MNTTILVQFAYAIFCSFLTGMIASRIADQL